MKYALNTLVYFEHNNEAIYEIVAMYDHYYLLYEHTGHVSKFDENKFGKTYLRKVFNFHKNNGYDQSDLTLKQRAGIVTDYTWCTEVSYASLNQRFTIVSEPPTLKMLIAELEREIRD